MARSMKNTQQAEAQNIDTTTAQQTADWGKFRYQASRSIMKRLRMKGVNIVLMDDDGSVIRPFGVRDLNSLATTHSITTSRYRDFDTGEMTESDYAEKTDQSVEYFLTDTEDLSTAK